MAGMARALPFLFHITWVYPKPKRPLPFKAGAFFYLIKKRLDF